MSIDKAGPPEVIYEVATDRNNNLVTPKTFEMMTKAEVEEVMAERRHQQRRPEWGKNQFGEDRPLSAWDLLD
jgi:hypothetical protein